MMDPAFFNGQYDSASVWTALAAISNKLYNVLSNDYDFLVICTDELITYNCPKDYLDLNLAMQGIDLFFWRI